MRQYRKIAWALALAMVAASPAMAQQTGGGLFGLFGPGLSDEELARRLEVAATHALGSADNPVRADMPEGQRAYLARLRCADGRHPRFGRIGNVGVGVFDNIVDLYDVDCGSAAPGRVRIYIDMYFPGYEETKPVEGFTLDPLPK